MINILFDYWLLGLALVPATAFAVVFLGGPFWLAQDLAREWPRRAHLFNAVAVVWIFTFPFVGWGLLAGLKALA